jgi:hypothetical protein
MRSRTEALVDAGGHNPLGQQGGVIYAMDLSPGALP